MARGAKPVTARLASAWIAFGLVAAVVAGTLAAVARSAGGFGSVGAADWAAVRFTLIQAALSAGLSVALAIPVARALARRRFPGRGALITALGAPFILPTVVAIFGLVAVFGRSGVVNRGLEAAGLPPVSIYGLQGVVTAHVLFNLPLAVRLVLQGWVSIPAERFRLAAALGFTARDVSRHLERPMLREVAPGIAAAIFLVCLTSFAVALTLGGGPRATTVELAIYQAFRFEFDLAHAATLAILQLALCAAAALAAVSVALPSGFGAGLDRTMARWDATAVLSRVIDALLLGLVTVFIVLPIGAVVLRGLPSLGGLPVGVWTAALRSVGVALASTALTMTLALAVAVPLSRTEMKAARLADALGLMALAASPLVIGTGLFILIRPLADPADLALAVTVLVNAIMALPFALRAVIPEARAVEAGFGRLADSLGLSGFARLRLLTLPRLRRPLGFAAGLSAALAMGDLGVIALFADPERATLPLQVYRLMGAYRMDQAAAAALLLLVLSFAAFWLFDRGGRHRADA